MTDYKQLCVELLSELENAIRVIHAEDGTRNIGGAYAVINKVKNTLAEPEPEGPTDEEILNLSQEHQVSYSMSDGRVIYPFQSSADMRDVLLSFARALIAADRARWGRVDVNPPAKLAHGTVQCW